MDWWIFSWHYSTRHVHKIKWLSLLCPGVVGSFCMNLCQCIKHLHSKRSTQRPFGNWHPDGLIGNYWQSIDARPELATGTQYLFSLASNYSTFCWGETHKNMCLWMGVSPNGFALLLSFTPTPASHKPTKAVLILCKGLEKRREWSLALWDKAIYSRWSANRPTNFLCGPSSSISASSGKRQANRSPNCEILLAGGSTRGPMSILIIQTGAKNGWVQLPRTNTARVWKKDLPRGPDHSGWWFKAPFKRAWVRYLTLSTELEAMVFVRKISGQETCEDETLHSLFLL